MPSPITVWLSFRVLRWLIWLAYAACAIEFIYNRRNHLDQFGHLLITTELWMFGLPLAGIFAGYFELMMRERTGLPRPPFGRNWLPRNA